MSTNARPDRDCEIAAVCGRILRVGDVLEMQATMQPPPPYDMAIRLAVDASTAHCGRVGTASGDPSDWLLSYQQFLKDTNALPTPDSALQVKTAMDRLKDQLDVRTGACFVPAGPER